MKKFLIPLLLFSVVFLISAAPPILRQFGTTNTPTVLTNIIQSLAGGGGQEWTNDGTYTKLTNTFAIRNYDHAVGTIPSLIINPPVASGADPLFYHFIYPQRGETTNYSVSFGEQANTNLGIYSTFTMEGTRDGNGFSQLFDMLISGYTNNSYARTIVSADAGSGTCLSQFTLQAGSNPDDDVVLTSTKSGGGQIDVGNVFSVFPDGRIWGLRLQVTSTTNHIIFGATNTAPVSAVAPTKWISVRINGESKQYRIPLYE